MPEVVSDWKILDGMVDNNVPPKLTSSEARQQAMTLTSTAELK